MVTDQGQRDETNESQDSDDDGGPPAASGPLSPRAGAATFSAEQHEYMGRKIADERKATLEKFKGTDEYKNMVARARRADQIEGDSRQKIEALEAQVSKLSAERAQALSKAEGALARAQMSALLAQRGVPAERIQDALILADTSQIQVNLEQGVVTGAEQSVQTLIESRPWLVGPGIAPANTQQQRPAPNLNGGQQISPVTEEARIAATMQEMAQRGMNRI